MGVLSDYLSSGYKASQDAYNVLSTKTGELIQSSGAQKILDKSVKPSLQSMTGTVSSTASDFYNNGVPVVKESATQIASLTVAASATAYNKVDEIAGGSVSATVNKASELVN